MGTEIFFKAFVKLGSTSEMGHFNDTCDWSVSLILSADWLMETGMMQYMMKYIIIFIIISIIITGMMQYMMKMMKMKYQPNQNGSSIR